MNYETQAIENGKQLLEQNEALKGGCCLIGWQLSSPCGESTLPKAKIELDGVTVSSDQVKGSKLQWFPQDRLGITTKYSNRLSRTFNAFGVKYGDLTVVPTARLADLQHEVDQIKSEWTADVQAIIDNYEVLLDEHCKKYPEISTLVRQYALTQGEFSAKFKLNVIKPLAMQALHEEDEAEIKEVLSDSLWQEISKAANQTYKANWFKNKKPVDQVSQKIRSPFRRMMDKLLSLSVVHEGALEVYDTIQNVLAKLPKSGYIRDQEFTMLTNWLLVMTNEETLKLHAEGNIQYSVEEELTTDNDAQDEQSNQPIDDEQPVSVESEADTQPSNQTDITGSQSPTTCETTTSQPQTIQEPVTSLDDIAEVVESTTSSFEDKNVFEETTLFEEPELEEDRGASLDDFGCGFL